MVSTKRNSQQATLLIVSKVNSKTKNLLNNKYKITDWKIYINHTNIIPNEISKDKYILMIAFDKLFILIHANN